MSLLSLRSRAAALVRANAPMLNRLPAVMAEDLPPIFRTMAKGILQTIPANFSEAIAAKVEKAPDEVVLKWWNYANQVFEYLQPGANENEHTQEPSGNLSEALQPGDGPGDDRQREDSIHSVADASINREDPN